MAVDGKYGRVDIPGIPDDEPVFILRGQDKLTPEAIATYRHLAGVAGCGDELKDAAWAARLEIGGWQARNPDRIKLPD